MLKKLLILFLLLVPSLSFSATQTWDAGGGDTLWSTSNNWVSNAAPVSGDNVTFNNSTISNYNTCTLSNVGIYTAQKGIISTYFAQSTTILNYQLASYSGGGGFPCTNYWNALGNNIYITGAASRFDITYYGCDASRAFLEFDNGTYYISPTERAIRIAYDESAGAQTTLTSIKINPTATVYMTNSNGGIYFSLGTVSATARQTNSFIVDGTCFIRNPGTFMTSGNTANNLAQQNYIGGSGSITFIPTTGSLRIGGPFGILSGSFNNANVKYGDYAAGHNSLYFGSDIAVANGRARQFQTFTNSIVHIAATNVYIGQGEATGSMLKTELQFINGSLYMGLTNNSANIYIGAGFAAGNVNTGIVNCVGTKVSIGANLLSIGHRDTYGITSVYGSVVLSNITGGAVCNNITVGYGNGILEQSNVYGRLEFDSGSITCSNFYIGSSIATSGNNGVVKQYGGTVTVHNGFRLPNVTGDATHGYEFKAGEMYLKGDWSGIASSNGFYASGTDTLMTDTTTLAGYTRVYYGTPTTTTTGHVLIPDSTTVIPDSTTTIP